MVAPAVLAAALLLCAGGAAPEGRPEARLLAAPLSYAVDSTVLLNEAARRDGEVSYKLRAALRVLPAWAAPGERLLRFELESPQLLARGAHANADYVPLRSLWDLHALSSFYAHWSGGLLQQLYLDPAELLDVQNFKRSLVSLFQLQLSEGERNETDVSGQCAVRYEALSDTTIRKIKRDCRAAGWEPGEGHDAEGEGEGDAEGEGEAEGEVQSRRLTRFSLNEARDALEEVYAEELHALGAEAGAALKARAWLRLTRSGAPPAAPPAAPTLADALRALPGALRPAPLVAAPPADLHATVHRANYAADLSKSVCISADSANGARAASGAELGAAAAAASGAAAGAGGTLLAARAALRLLGAAPRELAALLHDAAPPDRLAGLCAALGLAGSADAHRAAVAFLRLRHADAPAPLAHLYFAALALAPRPHPAAVADALRLADELPDAALAQSALLGAAAAAARAPPAAQRAARDALLRGLARCAADDCRRARLAALANLRRADTAAPLLAHAERGPGGGAAGAALDALDALLTAHGALPPDAPPRLARVALGGTGAALETRAAALDLLLRASAAAPFALPRVLQRLRAAREHELLRLAWRRLRELAPLHEPVRLMLRLLPAELRGWDARALAGASSLLVREAARGAGAGAGWRALLESRQVARGALLRRGRVRLLTLSPANRTDDTVTVELWTRGLDALAGAAPADGAAEEEEEEAAGGLELSVGGARLPPLTLFRGQAELLGHVWAGSGSEPTPVLRALRPAPPARAALPLLGGAALRYERRALLALALDADAQVSLWARTARTRLSLRAALAVGAEAAVRTAWGALEARADAELEPRLRIDADLDFYDAVALCVRAQTDRLQHGYNVTLTSEMGSARRRVRRSRARRWPWAGRTLALEAPNDATCRAMGPARD